MVQIMLLHRVPCDFTVCNGLSVISDYDTKLVCLQKISDVLIHNRHVVA